MRYESFISVWVPARMSSSWSEPDVCSWPNPVVATFFDQPSNQRQNPALLIPGERELSPNQLG